MIGSLLSLFKMQMFFSMIGGLFKGGRSRGGMMGGGIMGIIMMLTLLPMLTNMFKGS